MAAKLPTSSHVAPSALGGVGPLLPPAVRSWVWCRGSFWGGAGRHRHSAFHVPHAILAPFHQVIWAQVRLSRGLSRSMPSCGPAVGPPSGCWPSPSTRSAWCLPARWLASAPCGPTDLAAVLRQLGVVVWLAALDVGLQLSSSTSWTQRWPSRWRLPSCGHMGCRAVLVPWGNLAVGSWCRRGFGCLAASCCRVASADLPGRGCQVPSTCSTC